MILSKGRMDASLYDNQSTSVLVRGSTYSRVSRSCCALSRVGEQYCFPWKSTQTGHAASCAAMDGDSMNVL